MEAESRDGVVRDGGDWRDVLPHALVVLAILAYLPAVRAGFVFDDVPNILEAPALHWTELSVANVERALREPLIPTRPVSNLTFALNHLAGGLAPKGYHLVNIALHIAAGFALAWVLRLVLRAERPDAGSPRVVAAACTMAAGLFLLHPLNTQAVTYVVQRMTVLAALFSLLSFGLYLRWRSRTGAARRPVLLAGALFFWLLALGSKENALAMPGVVVAWEFCFRRGEWFCAGLPGGPRRSRGRILLAGIALLAGLAGAFAVYGLAERIHWNTLLPGRDYTGCERVLTQARVQVLYLSLLLLPLPSRLNLDHDFSLSRSLLDPWTTLPAVLLWAAVAVLAVRVARTRPALGFALLCYLVLHSVEAGPVSLEHVFEHRMYLPMAFLAVLPAHALIAAPSALSGRRLVIAGAAVLVLAGLTFARNRVWTDPVAFYSDAAAKSPGKARPSQCLGHELLEAGRFEEAGPPLERAVALDPAEVKALNSLGIQRWMTGRRTEALDLFWRAEALSPLDPRTLFNLGRAHDKNGDREEAVRYFTAFLSVAPEWMTTEKSAAAERLRDLR